MSPFSFLQRGNVAEYARQLRLATHTPSLVLEGLSAGVDNLRSDVYLSDTFCEQARHHIARLIAKYGAVEDLMAQDAPAGNRPPSVVVQKGKAASGRGDPGDFKKLLTQLHVAAMNRAKAEGNTSLDLLARLAILKFLRAEMADQYTAVLERCRAQVRILEGPAQASQARGIKLRERLAQFQLAKKNVLRKTGEELFHALRELEKETLARMRRSLFGEDLPGYELFMNRLVFTEDGRDDHINAEHYIMLGNFDRDPDRFHILVQVARHFFKSLELVSRDDEGEYVDGLLNIPENAQELVGAGVPEESSPKGKAQKALLSAWVDALENAGVMRHVVASYETVALLPEYTPPIHPQQLKNSLLFRDERQRVEKLLETQGKVPPHNLRAAASRVENVRGADLAKIAGRFMRDLMRYHRDLRRLETLNSAVDSVNLLNNDKLRELSSINRTLYEFLLPEERKPEGDRVVHHVILKADIRDSTTMTRTLFERGLNPASYFSLNFYEPINKLLPKYQATKVFIEGDAVILALFEREGEPGFGVARTCVLAKEIIEIVRAYNEQSQKAGLPTLELGIGISYQDAAPMYLMDGNSRIMISKALNESDRLSSCSKGVRRFLAGNQGLFNVYSFQTIEDASTGGDREDYLLRYNVGGININEAAFRKLQQEISLQAHDLKLPSRWGLDQVRIYSGLVPVGAGSGASGSFHQLAIREGLIPHIQAKDYSLLEWTSGKFYEVCSNPAIYQHLETGAAVAAKVGAGD